MFTQSCERTHHLCKYHWEACGWSRKVMEMRGGLGSPEALLPGDAHLAGLSCSRTALSSRTRLCRGRNGCARQACGSKVLFNQMVNSHQEWDCFLLYLSHSGVSQNALQAEDEVWALESNLHVKMRHSVSCQFTFPPVYLFTQRVHKPSLSWTSNSFPIILVDC